MVGSGVVKFRASGEMAGESSVTTRYSPAKRGLSVLNLVMIKYTPGQMSSACLI